jgi:hypothetical protein
LEAGQKKRELVTLLEIILKIPSRFLILKPESLIVLTILQEENLNNLLANEIQNNFTHTQKESRGTKQQPILDEFYMPSVLIELGLSNRRV